MKNRLSNVLIGVLLWASPAWAQSAREAEMPDGCEMTDSNGFLRTVICTASDADQDIFVAAGRAACGDDLPCGAWIWPNADVAPARIPENHDGLTQDEITSSRGVWVAEQEAFVAIDRAN